MSEQSLDVRSTMSILRRRRRVLAAVAVLGWAAGLAFVLIRPTMYESTTLVLLPPAQSFGEESTARQDATEVMIAGSEAVLGPAGASVRPRMSVREVAEHVDISAPASGLLEFEAKAATPALAEALAQAVAESEVAFVARGRSRLENTQRSAVRERIKELETSLASVTEEIRNTVARRAEEDPNSAEGKADAIAVSQLTAQQASLVLQMDELKDQAQQSGPAGSAAIVEAATPATRPGFFVRFLLSALVGSLLALLVAAVAIPMLARRDRRLRYRDELADAVGSPVVASVRSVTPRHVAGWSQLLEAYAPGSVDAWALRQALRQLAFGDGTIGPRGADSAAPPVSITVITLSDDVRALAIGPELAVYAASAGVSTRLVAAKHHESADALWASCHATRAGEVRPCLVVDTQPELESDVDLTVVLAVVDRRQPDLTGLPVTTATVLAVSSGAATAEDLARTAVAADDAGSPIVGIVVADPDSLDRTTGHLLQHERAQQAPLPTRLTGLPTTKNGPGNVSGLDRRPG